jgi:glycosyltransferase involved in cell wall biosynthesis
VVFTDFVTDEELELLYQDAALYVFPSLCEGFGLPPLEAMSHGLPVVCSSTTSLPEILGEAAIYFNPQDPNAMAEKINRVLSDSNLQKDLIARGFEQIKKYSWRKMGEETLKIYLYRQF